MLAKSFELAGPIKKDVAWYWFGFNHNDVQLLLPGPGDSQLRDDTKLENFTVKVNGMEEIVDIKIEPDVINPDDKGMLEDLVLAAANEGIKKAKKLRETELAKITGFSLPGMM